MRTREGRLLRSTREELTRHIGGHPTATQRALIERAAFLTLRCAMLDRRIMDGTFTDFDSKTYLAFSNSLTRTLAQLGLQPSAAKPPSLDEFLAARREGRAA